MTTIVVTGIGATSPLGGTARDSWDALLRGESGVRTLEHDPSLFTQGLQVVGDEIYESTGRVGSSVVQRRPLGGGEPAVTVAMAGDEFGEGLAWCSAA